MEYGMTGYGIEYLVFRLGFLIPLAVALDIILRERLIYKYNYKSKVMGIIRMIIVLPIAVSLGVTVIYIVYPLELIFGFINTFCLLIMPTIYAYYIFIIAEIIVAFRVKAKLIKEIQ